MEEILDTLRRFQAGDLRVRFVETPGFEELSRQLNGLLRSCETFDSEIHRVCQCEGVLLEHTSRFDCGQLGPFSRSAESLNVLIQEAHAPGNRCIRFL